MRLLTAFTAALALATPAAAGPKFVDPGLTWAVPGEAQRRQHPALDAAGLAPAARETTYRVLAAGDEFAVAKRIAVLGGKVLGYHPGAIHAEVTRAQLAMLAGDDALARLEISRRMRPSLEVSRFAVNADQVQEGLGLDQPYTGRGVIVGIVDTGIDIAHPMMRNADGSTRILSLWDQTIDYEDGSGRPAGFAYGIECSAEQIDAYNLAGVPAVESCPSDDGRDIGGIPTEGHGTHVAGIAAGNHETYRGIAPEASFVIVRALFEEGGILDGVDYVIAKCDEYQRPCVVNLSLGTTAGAHDGTALIERLLAGKTGPGRVIVASAGNEAHAEADSVFGHAAIPFANTGGLVKGPIVFPDTQYAKGDDYTLLLDAWSTGTGLNSFYVAAGEASNGEVTILNGFLGTYVTPPADGEPLVHVLSTAANERLAYVHLASAVDPENNRRETVIGIDRCSDKPCVAGGKIDGSVADLSNRFFIVSAQDAGTDTLHLWPANASGLFFGPAPVELEFTWPGVTGATHTLVAGDNLMTITIPATAREIIAVGSYITKTQWSSTNGTRQAFDGTRGELSLFSSRGPTSDGRVKPDVAAPGEWIASAHSAKDNMLPQAWEPAEGIVHLIGTSMAAPHVTGLVALMLERDGTLAPEDLLGGEGLVTRNTQSNDFTGTLPNADFGHGIIDAAAVFADPAFRKRDEADQNAPGISGVRVSSSGSSATVQFVTDEPAQAQIVLSGEGTSKTLSRASFTRSHRLKVGGLGDGTYSVTIKATDLAGNFVLRSAGKVDTGGDCGCQSKSGPAAWDALPFLLLAAGYVWYRKRV